MKSGMSHIFTTVCSINHESNKDTDITPRSKKSTVAKLFKNVFDGSKRVQTQYDSTLGPYQKGVEISIEHNKQSQDEASTTNKTHCRQLSHSKSMENYHIRKKSTVSEPGYKTPTPCGLENLGNTVNIILLLCLFFFELIFFVS